MTTPPYSRTKTLHLSETTVKRKGDRKHEVSALNYSQKLLLLLPTNPRVQPLDGKLQRLVNATAVAESFAYSYPTICLPAHDGTPRTTTHSFADSFTMPPRGLLSGPDSLHSKRPPPTALPTVSSAAFHPPHYTASPITPYSLPSPSP